MATTTKATACLSSSYDNDGDDGQDEEDEPENIEEIALDSVTIKESSLLELQFEINGALMTYIVNVNPKKKKQLMASAKRIKRDPPLKILKYIIQKAFVFTVTTPDGKTERFMNKKNFDQVFSPYLLNDKDLGLKPFRQQVENRRIIYA